MNNKIGELIEKYRKEKGLTQGELAKKLGVSNTAISKWEHGNNLPDITLLKPLSEILGIDKFILFTAENETKEETSERVKLLKRRNSIKLGILSIIFIFTIVFTNFISYKVCKHKLEKLESSQTTVYKFTSTNPEFIANGYLIMNNHGSNVIFEQLKYQKINKSEIKDISKNEFDDIELIELYFYINEKLIYSSFSKQKVNEKMKINEFLNEITGQTINNKENKDNDTVNMKIILDIYNNNQSIEKTVYLKLSTEI